MIVISFLLCSLIAAAGPEDEAIQKHILSIRSTPSIKDKKAACEALGDIGIPSLIPLMDYLHDVAGSKPNDAIWIHPDYIQDALSIVCKRAGPAAEAVLLARFLQVTNATERDCLYYSLARASSYPCALGRVLDAVHDTQTLNDNALWAIQQTVHFYVYGRGRDETEIPKVLNVLAKYPELEKRFDDIKKQVAILKTVGIPEPKSAFSPKIHQVLQVTVDEQTEFSIVLPRPNGPWGYHWGFGQGMETSFASHGLLYLGSTFGKNTVHFRFIGCRPLQTPLDVYVQGGVPDDDPAEYPMKLTVRALQVDEKKKRLDDLRISLDERKRQYAEKMKDVEQGKSSVRGEPR